MNKNNFIEHLRAIADILQPMTPVGLVRWDGHQYVTENDEAAADPQVTIWWSVLRTIAGLIEAQESPISPAQRELLRRTLFGTMGSLHDLRFPSGAAWVPADAIQKMEAEVALLYKSFKEL